MACFKNLFLETLNFPELLFALEFLPQDLMYQFLEFVEICFFEAHCCYSASSIPSFPLTTFSLTTLLSHGNFHLDCFPPSDFQLVYLY